MRHQFQFVWLGMLSLFLVALMAGCKENDEPSASLNISTQEIEVGCDGEEVSIEVTSNSTWSASSSASWVRLTPTQTSGDSKLKIRVLSNPGEARVATINFYVKNEPDSRASLKIHQDAMGEHSLSLSPMVVALENGNLEAQVTIQSAPAHGWSFEIIDGGEWMEVSKSDDKLNINADILKIPFRTGQIDIISAGNRMPVYVVQGDFREISVASISAQYYGQLNDMPYTTCLLYTEGNKYPSPFVGQDYLDYIILQINSKPVQSFEDFKLAEGAYPIFLQPNDVERYCSAGFFDESLGVYGSCWLRRWFYMDQDYGFNSLNIFTEGHLYITYEDDNIAAYLTATGYDQGMEPQTYVMKISGTVQYHDMTTRAKKITSSNNLLKHI